MDMVTFSRNKRKLSSVGAKIIHTISGWGSTDLRAVRGKANQGFGGPYINSEQPHSETQLLKDLKHSCVA